MPLTLTLTRHFDEPAERVYDAWLDPVAVGQWLFATPGGEMQRVEVDPRVGGGFVVVEKRGDLLAEHFGTYLELDRPRRLVFTFGVGRAEPPSHVTVEMVAEGQACTLTLTHIMDEKWAAYAEQTRTGWARITEGLWLTLAAERVMRVERVFDASRERVFAAWTHPEQIAVWWGPNGFSLTNHEMDVRPGGVWRYLMHGPDGVDYPNTVTYLEVTPPERLVYDHGDDDGPQFRVVVQFVSLGARTRLLMRAVFPTAAGLEAAKRFGAIEGGEQTLARLAVFLSSV